MFDRAYADMPNPKLLRNELNGIEDPIKYRLEQVSHVVRKFYTTKVIQTIDTHQLRQQMPLFCDQADIKNESLGSKLHDLLFGPTRSRQDQEVINSPVQIEEPLQLKIHWESRSLVDELNLYFPPSVVHVDGINVTAIDKECYDASDEDDDRNYRSIKQRQMEQQRRDKLMHLAKELEIPLDQVQQVLHDSRMAAKQELLNRGGKAGKKARTISVYDNIPKQVDLSETGQETKQQ